MLSHKKAIEEIVYTLDEFWKSMKQREQWLKWARDRDYSDPMIMASHIAEIAINQGEAGMMARIICEIRAIVERIDIEEDSNEDIY